MSVFQNGQLLTPHILSVLRYPEEAKYVWSKPASVSDIHK